MIIIKSLKDLEALVKELSETKEELMELKKEISELRLGMKDQSTERETLDWVPIICEKTAL